MAAKKKPTTQPSGTTTSVMSSDNVTFAVGSPVATQPALVAAPEVEATPEAATLNKFHGVLILEGTRTTDGREIDAGAFEWRELPLPLMHQFEDTGQAHATSRIVGRIETLERVDGEIRFTGTWDTGSESQEAKRLVDDQVLRWISADTQNVDYDIEMEGDCDDGEGVILMAAGEPCQPVLKVHKAIILGGTLVAFPAFPQAVILPASMEIPASTELGRPAGEAEDVVASGWPVAPPAEWFDNPELAAPTALEITDEGRIYGHAALWETCHIGYPDVCMTAPSSRNNYAFFMTGSIRCPDGCTIPVGQITMDTGHAPTSGIGAKQAAAHYDNTGSAVADVTCGEDAHGIWVAGALRPNVTDEQVRVLRASPLSGDWRSIGGNLELVGLLSVNIPGFPIPRGLAASGLRPTAHVEDGVQTALVAAGRVPMRDPLAERITVLEAELERLSLRLRPLVADRIRQRVSESA